MTTRLQTGMVEGGAATTVALTALRDLLIGMEADFPFEPALPWLPMYGQTLTVSSYPKLAAKFGVTTGSFTLPDHRGRVSAGLDTMGGVPANRLTLALGAAGGNQTHTLTSAQMPVHSHGGTTGGSGGHSHPTRVSPVAETSTESTTTGGLVLRTSSATTIAANSGAPSNTAGEQIGFVANHTHAVAPDGSGQAHNNLQPTIASYRCILAY